MGRVEVGGPGHASALMSPKGLIADRREHIANRSLAGFLFELAGQLQCGGFDTLDGSCGDLRGCALRQGQHRGGVVGLDRREEIELDPAAAHNAEGHEESCDSDGQSQIAPLDGSCQGWTVGLRDQTGEAAADALLKPSPEPRLLAGAALGVVKMREVIGENEKRFDERKNQSCDHDDRDHPHHFSHIRGDRQKRSEGRNCGQYREGDGLGHLDGSGLGSFETFEPGFVHGVDVFADEDRIVHDDAEYDNEREQRDQIHGDIVSGH